ncbi:hypothetical protein Bca52824_042433 [Brassica carinata]|uniref:Uncharacterized protein n=1 Tax=Brassica carinata TaxID=52824 RepID=A0A8X7S1K0_BRACI|nr:hypothetical protein Bca52824_042433 [Brassica carinata]
MENLLAPVTAASSVRSSEPPALVSLCSSLCISVWSRRRRVSVLWDALEDGAVSSYRSLPLAWSFSPISSSSLRIGGAWVVGGPLQVFSHLSGWLVTDGGYGVLLGFRLRALCSGHQTLALFSTGGLQWVAWGICKVGLRALLTVVLVAAHCGTLAHLWL